MPTMTREKDFGHREYKIEWTIQVTDPANDGPEVVLTTPGLPTPGSVWNFGNDSDSWAFCQLGPTEVKPEPQYGNRDAPSFWIVTQTFSTRAPKRCNAVQFQDPLLEPIRVSGTFVKYQEEAFQDRFGQPIQNSAFQQFRGQQVEFDRNRPQVKIIQNVPTFLQAAALPGSMMDTLNAYPLWGLLPRTIKLSQASWDRKYWGFCLVYYERTLTFDINYETFDRLLPDFSKKVLRGKWLPSTGHWVDIYVGGYPPNPLDPTHYVQYTDRDNKPGEVLLDGAGRPSGVIIGTAAGTGTGGTAGIRIPCYDGVTYGYVSVAQTMTVVLSGSGTAADGTYMAVWDGTNWVVWQPIGAYTPTFGPSMTINTVQGDPKDPSSYGTWQLYTPSKYRQLAGSQSCITPISANWAGVKFDDYVVGTATGNVAISAGSGGSGVIHQPGLINVQKYGESDFTLMGIPTVFVP
jgi:hypothetical protein